MKYILTFLSFLILTGTGYGQDIIKKNKLAFYIGPGFIARQDLIFSPFIHSDLSFMNLGVEYTRDANIFQNVALRYGNFNPMLAKPFEFTVHSEPQMAYPHSFNIIDLDYQIGKKIRQNPKTTFAIGGLFSTDIQAMNYVYGRFSSFGYFSALSIGLFGRHQYFIANKSTLTTTLQLPALTWLSRSPYLVNDDEFIENISSHSGFKTFMAFIGDGRLVTWNRLLIPSLNTKYTYSLNEKWELGAAYLFEFIHSSRPRNLYSYRHSIYFSINYNF